VNRLKLKTVRISKFIRQRVPDCRAGVVERLTAIRVESTASHSKTVPVGRSLAIVGEEQHQRLGWGDRRGSKVLVRADTGTPSHHGAWAINLLRTFASLSFVIKTAWFVAAFTISGHRF